MAGSPRQHEPVPDEVAVAQARIGDEEDSTQRVGQSPGHQPGQARCGQAGVHRVYRHDNEPSHQQVQDRGNDGVGYAAQHLQCHAGQRQYPDQYQQRPAPCPVQYAQGEWRVGSRDEQIDRRMVDDAEDVLESARTE